MSVGLVALARRHRPDDGLDLGHLPVVDVGVACLSSLGTPGMSDRSPPSEPSFFTCWSWARKSSRVKRPSSRRAAPFGRDVVVELALGLLDEA